MITDSLHGTDCKVTLNFVMIQVFTLFLEKDMTDSSARLSSVTMLNYF